MTNFTLPMNMYSGGATGVKIGALTAATTALTVNDMYKAVDKGMFIGQTYLLEKVVERVVIIKEMNFKIGISADFSPSRTKFIHPYAFD